jgi:hypothetical protein
LAGPKAVNTITERTDVPLGPVPATGDANVQTGRVECNVCGFPYVNVRGLSVHKRRKHPTVYHAIKNPFARAKARWDSEKRYLMAKEEIRLCLFVCWFLNGTSAQQGY